MRIRNILICVLTSLLCLGFFCPKAANAAQTPQEFVKGFYEWYIIKHYEVDDILEEEKLPEYVDDSLIGNICAIGTHAPIIVKLNALGSASAHIFDYGRIKNR